MDRRDPRYGSYGRRPLSRREFLRRSAGAALAVPSLSAILAACSKPGTASSQGSPTPALQYASPGNPVTLPLNKQPIPADTPIEKGATLQVYNWSDYLYKKCLNEFGEKFGCKWEYTTFNNMEEAVQKISSGQVQADVFFPTVNYLSRLVVADLLDPLQHDLIPNLAANYWPEFQNPFYDQGWHYTVPYTIYTTGIGYRRDHIDDAEVADKQYSIFWDPKFKGKVGIYDDYREALGMALLKNGVSDTNTSSQSDIDAAKSELIDLVNNQNSSVDINGAYAKLPDDVFWLHQAWSGDMIGAKWYLPKGTAQDVLGYWYPEDGKGVVGNDCIAIPSSVQNPRLAHEFLNFMLDEKYAMQNFAQWNGYQPPLTSIDPSTLIPKGIVPKSEPMSVVTPQDFDAGYWLLELSPSTDQIWLNAWDQIKAGA